jgi:hypothetical protein
MPITPRGLNRATLGRQLLLARVGLDVVTATRHIVAVQAQHPASPYLALWNRIAEFDAAELDAAFAGFAVVKSNMVRMTLHATVAEDYRAFREATEPSLRGAMLGRYFAVNGLSLGDGDALTSELCAFAERPRTAAECATWLEQRLGARSHRTAWRGLRQYAPLWRVPDRRPWSFDTNPSYVAPATLPTLADTDVANMSLRTLIRRYLAGFGPASVADMALFAQVQRARAKAAVRALGEELERLEGPGGTVLYDLPGSRLPDEDTPAPPRLLGMWDNVLLAHVDRDRVIPPAYRKHVTRTNGDVLPTLLVDGYVAGVWRQVEAGIEATAFHPLSDEVWDALAAEARSLLALLGERDRRVYGRYDRWWTELPAAEVRVLVA